MAHDLDRRAVQARLAALAAIYVPETRMQYLERRRAELHKSRAFASEVARRLDELRALDALTRYLHRATRR
jgi:hypothetical protein